MTDSVTDRFVLGRAPGPVVEIGSRGATVLRLEVGPPSARRDVIVELEPPAYRGTIGRTTNRIAGARFDLDGVEHVLGANDRGNNLHGGPDGWDTRDWTLVSSSPDHVELALVSPDGDQGFPGEVRATARYEVVGGALETSYAATAGAPTPVTMTNHAYVRLTDDTIHDHVLRVPADAWLPIDATGIPTGIADVEGTPFDLREAVRLGEVIAAGHPQVGAVGGIDHAYVLTDLDTWGPGGGLRVAAVLEGGGLRLTLETDQPSVQVYTGQALEAPATAYAGIALEPQQLPDSLHRPSWRSPVLRPGETYRWRSRITVTTTE